MSDDKANAGGNDRKRINIGQDYEVRDWARRFGVTPERLRQAVLQVGTWAAAVERELGRPRTA